MNNEDYATVFDSWELLTKARKPKGLQSWGKLSHIANKLKGKHASHISFTCSHPTHAGSSVHNLGSVEGNLHFLLGYGNPAFHMMPYHWQIIDPLLDDEEAEKVHETVGHPSRPDLWSKSKKDSREEGEVELGMPHPSVAPSTKDSKKDGIATKSGFGSYTAVPSSGLVYGDHNNHVYHWDLVKDSYFAATNKDIAAKMDAEMESITKSFTNSLLPTTLPPPTLSVPNTIKYACISCPTEYAADVYPLVKSKFPVPGSVLLIKSQSEESVYSLISHDAVSFFDKFGQPINVVVYNKQYPSFDLTKGGDTHPSILYNFAVNYLGLNKSELEEFVHNDSTEQSINTNIVVGVPTPGFDSVPSSYDEGLNKSVQISGNTYRLVVRPE